MKFFGSKKDKQEQMVDDSDDINLDDVSLDDAADETGAIVPTGGPVAGGVKKKGSFGILAVVVLLAVIAGGGVMVVTGGDLSMMSGSMSSEGETAPVPPAAEMAQVSPSPVLPPVPVSAIDPLSTEGGGFAAPAQGFTTDAPLLPANEENAVTALPPAISDKDMPVTEMSPDDLVPAETLPPVPDTALDSATAAVSPAIPAEHAMGPTEERAADEEIMNDEDKTVPHESFDVELQETPPPPTSVDTPDVPAIKVAEPSAAEKALVENAAVLDQLSQTPQAVLDNPAMVEKAQAMKMAASSSQIPAEAAQIRDLPNSYFLLRKDKEASQSDQRMKAANRALTDGNAGAAVEMYDRLRSETPDNGKVLMGRAIALQRSGQNTAAVDAYEEVLRKNPKNIDALTNMLGLLRKQSPELALDKLKELHGVYPFNVGILAQLGTVYGDMGRYDEGHRFLDQAIAMAPSNALYVLNKAILYDRMGDVPHAAQMYRFCLDLYYQDGSKQAVPVEQIKKRLAAL